MPQGRSAQTSPPAPRAGGRPAPAPAASRRGIVGVVAMMFLVLFAVLAVGFYAAVTMSAQISANEQAVFRSQLAAESGMSYLRLQLASVRIPAERPPDKVFEELFMQLRLNLCGTGNLGSGDVGYDGYTITIPADPGRLVMLGPDGAGFRATLTRTTIWSSGAPAYRVRVKVTGCHGSVAGALRRAVEVEYDMENVRSTVFDYGVAATGPVQFKPGPTTKLLGEPDAAASILTASALVPSIVTGKGDIDGNLFVSMSPNQVVLGGGKVGGQSDNAVILSQVQVKSPPDFPTVHTVVFKEFATNVYVAGVPRQKNIRVPPNINPTFSSGNVIDGILYIESPNVVTFSGHTDVNGVIVFEGLGTPAVNVLDFKGNVSQSALPDTAEYAALKARAAGLAIVAPTAAVNISSSVESTLTGSVIANRLAITGSADVTLVNGSLITLGSEPMLIEGKTVNVIGVGARTAPYAAVRFESHFRPVHTTYREVAP
jgi:hypothetical protein